MCTDGQHREALPDPSASIDDLTSSYSSAAFQDFVANVLERRYPVGAHLVSLGRMSDVFTQDCVDVFLRNRSSASGVISDLSTVVHECGHFADLAAGFSVNEYIITQELTITCTGGDTTSRGGNTFARSRLNGDDYASVRPACGGSRTGCDTYADVYLDGNPDDSNFEGGDQGFNSVIEEATQYVNSLATSYAFTNELGGSYSTSERDGILTFLWYIERYLRMARTDFPSAHTFLVNDACWQDAILTIWGRAWLYLEATRGMPHLGIDDTALEALVGDPALLDEIQAVRDAAGC